jgi:hypothetical protein
LRRCTQVHEGYEHFPAGTVVRWKVKQLDVVVARGSYVAEGGRGNHFITQPLGVRLAASPEKGSVYYRWTINGVEYRRFARVTPGCSGTSRLGTSGPGDFFVVKLLDCQYLKVGYHWFPTDTHVEWMVQEGTKTRLGSFTAHDGFGYQWIVQPLGGTKLRSGVGAKLTFRWVIYEPNTWVQYVHYHYVINRATGC